MSDAGIIHFGHMAQIFLWYVGYKFCFMKETVALRKKFYRFFLLKNKKEIDGLILKAYEARVRPHIRKHFCPLIEKYKSQGYLIVAVSGTLQLFCDLIKKEFDMNYAFGTKLCVEGGAYSDSWEGVIFEGIGKAEFIKKFAYENGVNLAESVCYADSCSDIPSLELCGTAIAVTPDRLLTHTARQRGWEILSARIS